MKQILNVKNGVNNVYCLKTKRNNEEELKEEIMGLFPEGMNQDIVTFDFIETEKIEEQMKFHIELQELLDVNYDKYFPIPTKIIKTFICDLDSLENEKALDTVYYLETQWLACSRYPKVCRDTCNFYVLYKEELYTAEDFIEKLAYTPKSYFPYRRIRK